MSDAAEPLTDLELIQALAREECRCGAFKKRGHSFCAKCFYSLPEANRRALFTQPGKGYREAFEAACALLDAGEGAP
jgi:hypothetical protein